MAAKAPTRDKRHGEAGNDRRRQIAQEQEDHQNDERHRESELELNILERSADRRRAVAENSNVDRARQSGLERRQQAPDRFDDLDDIRSRLALNIENDGGRPVGPGGELVVFGPEHHMRRHRGAAPARPLR